MEGKIFSGIMCCLIVIAITLTIFWKELEKDCLGSLGDCEIAARILKILSIMFWVICALVCCCFSGKKVVDEVDKVNE